MHGEDEGALNAAATPQPAPTGNGAPVLELVIADLQARSEMGRAKYGTVLRAGNGRDALMDAYQEALDQAMYLRQALTERDQQAADHRALAPGIADLAVRLAKLEREVALLRRDVRA